MHRSLVIAAAFALPLALASIDCVPETFDEPLDDLPESDAHALTEHARGGPPVSAADRSPTTPGDSVPTTQRAARAWDLDAYQPKMVDHCDEPASGVMTAWTDGASWELPLLHTDVDAAISGMVADVSVIQTFTNPFDDPIEAVYTFPLPDDAAVDGMTLRVGDRVIEASVHEKDEAKEIYEEARRGGLMAARLDQERPNVFVQNVANLMPGAVIEVELHLVQPLEFEDGGYDWTFPLVVGPRYVPGDDDPNPATGGQVDLAAARDALDVPYSPTRTGNDVDIAVSVDAGVAITDIHSPSHDIVVDRFGAAGADVALAPDDTIPNKDFVLRYEVGGEAPEVALLAQHDDDDPVFMLVIQPPAEAFVTDDIVTPKEMVFVVDTSCSMSGYPLDKAKDAMTLAISEMNPDDRFTVMDFNDKVSRLAPRPLDNTTANRRKGLAYVESFRGNGGTRMLDGIEAALDLPADPELLRTVVFLTDGYIGNEADILSAIDQRLGARTRLFSLGIGSSVNRYLLDRMAKAGRGDVEYVLHAEQADEAVANLYERIRNPVITNLEVDFGGAEVSGVYPDPLPDLFAGQPIVLMGRYSTPGPATITVRGQTRNGPYEQVVDVVLPADGDDHPGLPSLWARQVVDDLESRNRGGQDEALNAELLDLALHHGLMTRLTSMVAVDSEVVNPGGDAERHEVPLETPEGVDLEAAAGPLGPDGLARPNHTAAANPVRPPACDRFDDRGLGGEGGLIGVSGAGLGGSAYGYGSGSAMVGGRASGSGTTASKGREVHFNYSPKKGLGTRGSGLGGGGTAQSLGGLGSRGMGSGASGYGKGGGLRKKVARPEAPRGSEADEPAPAPVQGLPEGSGGREQRAGNTPTSTVGDPIILGAIDKSTIDRVVKNNLAAVRYCYQRVLQARPNLGGKITLKFVIGKDGAVSSAAVKTTTLGSPAVEDCVVKRFEAMQFPKPRGGGIAIVTYPLVFNPD